MSLIVGEKDLIHAKSGELYSRITQITAVRDFGGYGFKGTIKPLMIDVRPKREPDHVVEEQLPKNLAILYRLTGDTNVLHIDPKVA